MCIRHPTNCSVQSVAERGAAVLSLSRNRPRVPRAMGQDYPVTGPSPGANLPIYPSSLPLA